MIRNAYSSFYNKVQSKNIKHSIVLGQTSNEKTLGSRNTIIICAKWSIISHLKAQNKTNAIHGPTPTKSPIEVF